MDKKHLMNQEERSSTDTPTTSTVRHEKNQKKQGKKKSRPTAYDTWGAKEVEPGVFCSSLCEDGQLICRPIKAPHVTTSWAAFQHGLSLSPKRNCLGWRSEDRYNWWSYEETAEKVRQLCAAFKTKTTLSRQQFVGIYASSSQFWAISALAINARSLCIVPLYDTLGPDACCYIICQTEMTIMFVDKPAAVGRILDSAKETPSLKTIICYEKELSDDLLLKAQSHQILLITLDDFVADVDPKDEEVYAPPDAEDIAVVQYTSGTTGYPKGVIIYHRAFIADMVGFDYPFAVPALPLLTISEQDVCLIFLPMAHIYAQIVVNWFYLLGGSIGFYGGNVMKIVEDAALLRPTFIPLVPRIMNRVYTKIKSQVGERGLKAKLFWFCYKRKRRLLKKGIMTNKTIYDKLVFRRIQRLLGGRVRYITVGSAPISADVLEFWRICMGCVIGEGYGQTEATVIATMAIGPVGGNVGPPLCCNFVKLADAEECGYFVKDGKGEVCIKGPNVMTGYYKQPDKTAEALDEDGWLHTGDIGSLDKNGVLTIFDRKKHIFKLSQGEYIAPEKVENVYIMSPLVAQVFVDGSSSEPFSVAIVVPDAQAAEDWAKANDVPPETVMSNLDFAKYILGELIKVGKENKLNSLEQVKNIYVTADAFSPANGLLTPSLKNKRPQLRRAFKDQIDAMYKAGPLIGEVKSAGDNEGKTKRR